MTERQFRLLADLAILVAAIAIAVIVLSPSGSFWAGGERGRHLSHQQTWILHGLLFASLGFVIAVRLAATGRTATTMTKLMIALLLLTLLGGLAELAQLQIHSRSASYGDWIGDTIGAGIGLWIGALVAHPLMLLVTHDEPAASEYTRIP